MNLIPHNEIESKILEIRDTRVMIDADIAELYGVETKRINEAVKNNPDKFPSDFMFELSKDEVEELILRSKFSTSSWGGRRHAPKAFTEQGVYMLATVLKSQKATETTIAIMRAFTKIRQLGSEYLNLFKKIDRVESESKEKYTEIESHLSNIYQILDELINRPESNSGVMGFIKQDQKEERK